MTQQLKKIIFPSKLTMHFLKLKVIWQAYKSLTNI